MPNNSPDKLHDDLVVTLKNNSLGEFQAIIKAENSWSEILNQRYKFGYTALILAAKNGSTDILKAIIDNDNGTHMMLNQETDYGDTALTWAAKNGHIDIVQALLESDDAQAKTLKNVFSQAVNRQDTLFIQTIINSISQSEALKNNIEFFRAVFIPMIDNYLSPQRGISRIFKLHNNAARFFSGSWKHHYIKDAERLKKIVNNNDLNQIQCMVTLFMNNMSSKGEFYELLHQLDDELLPDSAKEFQARTWN